MMVNTDFQLESIQNHLQGKPMGLSMSEFLEGSWRLEDSL